ncbi:hypothetical protein MBRA1_003007 [Malassezia brasiliensis]|uniref:Maintenance of telomere capping protein 1 n=1 Tax=Malassezia brasiliensis TaxID=1821822 RepID=A0AAF0DU49_9BASI|nr:hypothetical protein MBRA1_003007 [Malassezia brasiliensis]
MASQRKQDVDALLADLSFESKPSTASVSPGSTKPRAPAKGEDVQSLLDDLEGLVQRQSAPSSNATEPNESTPADSTLSSWGQWGGSWFSNATRIADQARHELERRAAAVVQKAPPMDSGVQQPIQDIGNRFAERFRGLVKDAGLDSLGQNLTAAGRRGWSDIVNAVAPPMEAHESVDVTLSHDMVGYDGIESLAFKVLSRILQQADITQVDVHTVSSEKAASQDEQPAQALHVAPSRSEGIAQAKAAIVPLTSNVPARSSAQQENSLTMPDSTCPIVLRLQPFYESAVPLDEDVFGEAPTSTTGATVDTNRGVSFLVWWVDPTYRLSHTTVSQAIPAWWLTVPLEHNVWVEQAMCDAIEGALAVVAQDSG